MIMKFPSLLSFLLFAFVFSCANNDNTPSEKVKLFYGGTILTVDDQFNEVEAVVVENEKIIETGAYQDLAKKYEGSAELIDLEGKVMLPGFIDAHAHVVAGAAANYLNDDVSMTKFSTTEEVLNYLREKAANTPEGEWIAARNWDPSVQDGIGELTFEELNAVSTTHPVFVLNASGHLAYANEKAFEVAGIGNSVV